MCNICTCRREYGFALSVYVSIYIIQAEKKFKNGLINLTKSLFLIIISVLV